MKTWRRTARWPDDSRQELKTDSSEGLFGGRAGSPEWRDGVTATCIVAGMPRFATRTIDGRPPFGNGLPFAVQVLSGKFFEWGNECLGMVGVHDLISPFTYHQLELAVSGFLGDIVVRSTWGAKTQSVETGPLA